MIPRPAEWRAGDPAPWPIPARRFDVAELVDVVTGVAAPIRHDQSPYDVEVPDGMRASAVLVVLADGPHGAEVLLTRRSMEMRTHKGEMSFPGGRLDPGEAFGAAALREAHEEVGLDPQHVEVVGTLPPLRLLASTSWILPIVGRVPAPLDLGARTREVDRVLWVPVAELTRPGTYSEEYWQIPAGEFSVVYFHLDDETVWGATARVLQQLLRAAHGLALHDPPIRYREELQPRE